MNLIEIITLLSFVGCLAVFVVKLWNIVNVLVKKQEGYQGIWIFVGMGAYLILWLFLLTIIATDPATDLAITGLLLLMVSMSNIFLFLTSMLTIIELLLKFSVLGEQIRAKPDFRERGVSYR